MHFSRQFALGLFLSSLLGTVSVFAQQAGFEVRNTADSLGTTGARIALNSGDMNYQCRSDPVELRVNVTGAQVTAFDAKLLFNASEFAFSNTYATTTIPTRMYPTYDAAGTNYPYGFLTGNANAQTYLYINATANDKTHPITGSQKFAILRVKPTGKVATSSLSYYYIPGQNGNDSNVQSGQANSFVDILTGSQIVNGTYKVAAYPCVTDTDAPVITGYTSTLDQTQGTPIFKFTISDRTGAHTVNGNSTINYRWTTQSSANNGPYNLAINGNDYVPSDSTIDNQQGVDPNSLIVSLSGIQNLGYTGYVYSGGEEVPVTILGSTTLHSGDSILNCNNPYEGLGSGITWQDKARGYTCTINMTNLGVMTNQTIAVSITGNDNANQFHDIHTGATQFVLTVTGINNFPPYIVTGRYTSIGANGTTTLPAGPMFGPNFSQAAIPGWNTWTNTSVVLTITGNKAIQALGVTANSYGNFHGVNLVNKSAGFQQQFTFDNNFSGFILFKDVTDNIGWTYQTGTDNYASYFNIDVFWIDTTPASLTLLTGTSTAYGNQWTNLTKVYTLSGANVGDQRYTSDDEFQIIGFSGAANNASGLASTATPTASGNILTVLNSNSKQVNFIFTTGFALTQQFAVTGSSWSGRVLAQDRAGNISTQYIDVNVNPTQVFHITAVPSDRNVGSSNYFSNPGSGMIAKMTFRKNYTLNGQNISGTVVESELIKTNPDGTYAITTNVPDGNYLFTLEGQSTLSQWLTGTIVNGAIPNLDFTQSPAGSIAAAGDMLSFTDCAGNASTTLTACSQKDGSITTSDIITLLNRMGQGAFGVYDGGFNVWTGGTNT